ncbi:MAG: sulfotransferase domain-containing protein [Rhodospirillales bacterium]|nr:sulfotransferase domain-containing protein [Rhodospirillales bacterium]
MNRIVWLASYPKSGNTWLRAFLANYLARGVAPVDINALPSFAHGDMRIDPYVTLSGKSAGELHWDEINALRPRVQRFLSDTSPARVFVKTHTVLTLIAGLPTITPEATYAALYVVRNPLDVAVSFAHHYGLTMDEGVRAVCLPDLQIEPKDGHILQIISDWSTHVRSWTEASGLRRCVLRYEDMTTSPQRTFGDAVDFLGLAREREQLKRAIRQSSFAVLAEQERRSGFVERSSHAQAFFRRGKVGGYRNELSAEQIDTVIKCHRDQMIKLGYLEPDNRLRV